jgi:hypothetical protein
MLIDTTRLGTLTRFQDLGAVTATFNVEALCGDDMAARIARALGSLRNAKTGKSVKTRKCVLSPQVTTWLVLFLALFRSQSVLENLRQLVQLLRCRCPGLPLGLVTDGAVSHARARLGAEPLQRLFEGLGASANAGPRLHGFRVLAIDGFKLSMPDTAENVAAFGKPKNNHGPTAFPQLLVVGLLVARTHEFVAATIMPCTGSERAGARELLKHCVATDLLLMDRGFPGVEFLKEVSKVCHFVCRIGNSEFAAKLKKKRVLADGSYIAEMSARVWYTDEPSGKQKSKRISIDVRVVDYVSDFGHSRIITSLTDERIDAVELVKVYHERWDFELANDETKTHLIAPSPGVTDTMLRSKSEENVRQEVYAMLVVHQLIRRTMTKAALAKRLVPTTLSFVGATNLIRRAVVQMGLSPTSVLKALHAQLLVDVSEAAIDRPRRQRAYVRAKRSVRSRYRTKRKWEGETPLSLPKVVPAEMT